jgi:hypothetical protein
MEVGEIGIEEGEGFVCVRDAPGGEQLSEHMRQPRGFGQFCGCFGVRLCEDPSLIGAAMGLLS